VEKGFDKYLEFS